MIEIDILDYYYANGLISHEMFLSYLRLIMP